ncbi:MAG: alpha/beta hydrolase [Candidatus Latescibacterota bacterium]|nr:MAG: alpha/beta hydrolase [Candidatus Latescibacterota bacterium]
MTRFQRSRVIELVLTAVIAAAMFGMPVSAGSEPVSKTTLPEPVATGYLELDDGRIFYESFGRGFPLVLIHDGLAHRVIWDKQVRDLATDYHVTRYDRRGYGRSDEPTAAYSNVADLHALIEHLGLKRVVLMGSSSGGGLAIDYTLAHSDRVEALILVGPVVGGLGYSFHFMRRGYANYSPDVKVAVENWIGDRYAVARGNDEARARLAEILRANPRNLSQEKHQFVQLPDRPALGRLSEIAAPTLIVTSDSDVPDVHAHAGAIESGIAGARRVVIDNAGHLPYLEQPQAFNGAVREFLDLLTIPKGEADLAKRAKKPWSNFERGIVPVENGEIYFEVMGEGETIVLAHGGMLDHRMWDDQFELFARDFRVVRYDARGHGLSRSPYGARRDFEDLRVLLDHLGISRTHLIGLSLGGRIAIDFALEHPDRVLKLIPVAPGLSGYDFDADVEQTFFEEIRAAYIEADFDRAAEIFLHAWTVGPRRQPDEVDPQMLARLSRWIREGAKPGKDRGYALPPDPPAIERLGEIKIPTLVVIGDLDMPGILEIAGLIKTNVPGARKIVIKGAAHTVNVERSEEFNKVVLEFLNQ